MRISDWSSVVCSSDLATSTDRATSVPTAGPAASTVVSASTGVETTGEPGLSGALAGSSASITAAGGAGGLTAVGAESVPHSATGTSSVRLPADDALPGAPVYDTDISPDRKSTRLNSSH